MGPRWQASLDVEIAVVDEVQLGGSSRVGPHGSGLGSGQKLQNAKAHSAGLSRTEYLRRTPARETSEALLDVTTDDLAAFADTFCELGDKPVMDAAWR
jgi:hypothetical protein